MFEELRLAQSAIPALDAKLRVAMAQSFLAKYPADPLVPLVRAYLALSYLERHPAFELAQAQLDLIGKPPPGTISHVTRTARARLLRLRGNTRAAEDLLRADYGKDVEPYSRRVYHEELVLVALARGFVDAALERIDDLLRVVGEEGRSAIRAEFSPFIRAMPKAELVRWLLTVRPDEDRLGFADDVFQLVVESLAAIAISTRDHELARLVEASDPSQKLTLAQSGTGLSELSQSRRGLSWIDGRRLGILLTSPDGSAADSRAIAADSLRGALFGLRLPRRSRSVPSGVPESEPDARAAYRCASPEPVSPTNDDDSEGIHVQVRETGLSATQIEDALDDLAGGGAVGILALTDPRVSSRVSALARERKLPTVFLHGTTASSTNPAVPELALAEPISSLALQMMSDEPANVALSPTFDIFEPGRVRIVARACRRDANLAPWAPSARSRVLILAAGSCADTLWNELPSTVHALLPLVSTMGVRPPAAVRVTRQAAGVLPLGASRTHAGELGEYVARFGSALSWWTALARDGAALLRDALSRMPTSAVRDPADVERRRELFRQALATARVRLWTSERLGFSPSGRLARTTCVVP